METRRAASAAASRKRAKPESRVGTTLKAKDERKPFQSVEVLSSAHVVDARHLYKLAREHYAAYRAKIPSLPDFDARDQHGAKAMTCCLDVVSGEKHQHVDRGLFNLVTGDGASLSNLAVGADTWPATAFPDGAVLAIQGYTAQLLDSDLVAPTHSAKLQPGQQLVVLAVRVTCEEVLVPGRGGLRLQAALAAAFGAARELVKAEQQQGQEQRAKEQLGQEQQGREQQGQEQQGQEQQGQVQQGQEQQAEEQQGVVQRAEVSGGAAPGRTVNIVVRDQQGGELIFRILRQTRLGKIMAAYCARKSIAEDSVRFLYDNDRLYGHETVEELEMEDGDAVDVVLEQLGD